MTYTHIHTHSVYMCICLCLCMYVCMCSVYSKTCTPLTMQFISYKQINSEQGWKIFHPLYMKL